MSDQSWREPRPSSPYGGDPGDTPRGRVPGPPPAPTAGARTPGRDPGRGEPDPRGSDPRRRDPGWDGYAPGQGNRAPGWDGRDPGRRGPGGTGWDQGPPAARGGGQGSGPQTRGMPAQAGATGPRQIPDTRTRPAVTQPEGRRADAGRAGAGRGAGRPRDVRGRRDSPRGPGRWGTWQGGLGVCIVVASAAAGAIATILTRREPGFLLELLVVAGTVAAALAVRPRAGRMILPVPALAYPAAALLSGVFFDRAADSSRTELALAAAQWIANGFVAMALATGLAVVIISVRWYLWHRAHRDKPAARDRALAAPPGPGRAGTRPARTGPDPGSRRSRTAWEAPAGSGYPAGYAGQRRPGAAGDPTQAWGEPGSRGAGPRSGSGPYNFSSGA